jgi:hypothetical protein
VRRESEAGWIERTAVRNIHAPDKGVMMKIIQESECRDLITGSRTGSRTRAPSRNGSLIDEKVPVTVTVKHTDSRGYERMVSVLDEVVYCIRIHDIDLAVRDALRGKGTFEFFIFQLFFKRKRG